MPKSAAEFRTSTELRLPSGRVVEVRKPNLMRLIMANAHTGTVPTPLVDQALAQFNKDIQPKPWEPSKDDLAATTSFMDLIVRATLHWPRIADNPNYEAGEIAIDDLDGADYQYIVMWAMPGEQAALSSFRHEPGTNVATVQSVNGVIDAAEPVAQSTE